MTAVETKDVKGTKAVHQSYLSQIYMIMGKTGVTRNELSFMQQNCDISTDSDLNDFSNEKLKVILKRARALDRFYSDPKVQHLAFQLTIFGNARNNLNNIFTAYSVHYLIQTINELGHDEIAPKKLVSGLINVLKSYHVTTVQASQEEAELDEDDFSWAIATPKYFAHYFDKVFKSRELRDKAKQLKAPYVAIDGIDDIYGDGNTTHFTKIYLSDIKIELEGLASYLSDHANPEEVNDKYYPFN